MLIQTKKLYSIFSKEQIEKINYIIEQIKREGDEYKTINLWKFDQEIGGIGGYCQGCDPARSNPFQGTAFRNTYRCLQYVRSNIDLLNISDTARYIIQECGHHLEEVIKIYLKRKSIISQLQTAKFPLGKLVQYVIKKKIIEEEITNKLVLFVELYNISKHEIQSNDEIDRTFHADDAIVYYFACRIVGKDILLKVDNERESQTYEIDWNKYNRKTNRF